MKTRTTLAACAVVAVALIAAGLLMVETLRDNLGEQVGLQAENAARNIAAQLATGADFDDLEPDSALPVQVVDDDGRLRAASSGLEAVRGTGTEEVHPDPWAGAEEDDDDDDDNDDDDDGTGEVGDRAELGTGVALINGVAGDYRFAAVEAETPAGINVTVHAGAPLEVEQAAVATVRTSLLIGFPVLLLLVGAITWLVTQRALRPVEGIRRELSTITHSEDPARRVPEPASRDEIGRLARTTNETLAALEHSVDRQRRFVADASHELRSPIASLRTQLEVGQAHPELLDVAGAVQDTVRLQNLATDLLLLARLDAGEGTGSGATVGVPLDELAADEVSRRDDNRIAVTTDRLDRVVVPGSAGMVTRVVVNLLDNAVRHAESRVRVSVAQEGNTAALEIADDGAGVAVGERERIFERFVRLDDARSRDEGGAGLGLAIARHVAERHGGTLTVADAPEGGALFRLRLPREWPARGG